MSPAAHKWGRDGALRRPRRVQRRNKRGRTLYCESSEGGTTTAQPCGPGALTGRSRSVKLSAPKRPHAFSLIELLVVIAIIAVLAALLLPVFRRAQEEGRATACVSNLHQIGAALQMYVDSNHNTLPVMEDAPMNTNVLATASVPTVNVVLGTDLGNTNVLRCPSDFQKIFQLTGSSYAWNNLLNGENADHLMVFGMDFRPGAIPVFFDKQGFHAARGAKKAVNYLYADQHIKNLLTIEGSLPQ